MRWDFPQLGMTAHELTAVLLIIGWAGSLNTDYAGPQRGCSLRGSPFISFDNIPQPPGESPFFYGLQ